MNHAKKDEAKSEGIRVNPEEDQGNRDMERIGARGRDEPQFKEPSGAKPSVITRDFSPLQAKN